MARKKNASQFKSVTELNKALDKALKTFDAWAEKLAQPTVKKSA